MFRCPVQGQFMDRYGIILQCKTQIVGYDTHFYITSQIMTLIQMLFKLPISYLSFMGNYEDDEPSVDIYACQPLTSTLQMEWTGPESVCNCLI